MATPTKRYAGTPGFDVGEPPPPTTACVAKPDDTITLRGVRVPLNSDVGAAFVADCCRNREKIFSDDRLREKYGLDSDAAWTEIVQNKALRLAISSESERRMLRGTTAQESAAKIFTEAPQVLGSILRDDKASPRHRIEASKELRATARSGDEKTGDAAEHVIITINLGGDEKLVYDCGPPKHPKEPLDAEADPW